MASRQSGLPTDKTYKLDKLILDHKEEVAIIDKYKSTCLSFIATSFRFLHNSITLKKSDIPTVRYCSIHFLSILLHHI